MKYSKLSFFFALLAMLISSCTHNEGDASKISSSNNQFPKDTVSVNTHKKHKKHSSLSGKALAEEELKKALKNPLKHYENERKNIPVKDSLDAINIAESNLFPIYGKATIVNQRPYEAYLIKEYWVIMGTCPKISHQEGGEFLIIIHAKDGGVIKMSHGI